MNRYYTYYKKVSKRTRSMAMGVSILFPVLIGYLYFIDSQVKSFVSHSKELKDSSLITLKAKEDLIYLQSATAQKIREKNIHLASLNEKIDAANAILQTLAMSPVEMEKSFSRLMTDVFETEENLTISSSSVNNEMKSMDSEQNKNSSTSLGNYKYHGLTLSLYGSLDSFFLYTERIEKKHPRLIWGPMTISNDIVNGISKTKYDLSIYFIGKSV
jgi:hypothetical protein